MSRYWSDIVRRLHPYVPGEQPRRERLVKLNTNENPYGPSPRVMEAIAAVSADELRLYPDPESVALKQAFAEREGLQPDQVFIGNGSDEVLAHCFQALLKKDRPLLFPDISYSFYPVWCELYGIDYRQVPLAEDFRVDVDAFDQDNGGVIVPNPNAPTGMLLELDEIRALLARSARSVVVIDEAYIDFGGDTATALVNDHDNLLVVQTLSKSRSLAGLRVGVAFGQADLIEALNRIKNSFNSYPLDLLAQRATLAALQDEEYFRSCCERVCATREKLADELRIRGFEVLPSAANFIFVRHRNRPAEKLFAGLRDQGIIVRYFRQPRIDNFLRISIGTDAQCEALLAGLDALD